MPSPATEASRPNPSAALARFDDLINPVFGPFKQHRTFPSKLDGLLYCSAVNHRHYARSTSLARLTANLWLYSTGIGRTPEEAKVKALFEAIERYAAVWQGSEPVIRDTYENLATDGALHVNTLLGFSDRQYDQSAACDNADKHKINTFFQVPARFDVQAPINWISVESLTAGPQRYIPAMIAYSGYPQCLFGWADSNGNAASSYSRTEALLSGLLETIERDAISIWFYNRLRRPAADTSGSTLYPALKRRYAEAYKRDLWVLDLTTDLGVPVAVALSSERSSGLDRILYGFGAGITLAQAVDKALIEVCQLAISLEHAPPSPTKKRDALVAFATEHDRWLEEATLKAHPYLLPDEEAVAANVQPWPKTKAGALSAILQHFSAKNYDVYALDLTRSTLRAPVVKVICPDLVFFWRRFGKQRLYDVPVRMGWRDAPIEESQLNPYSIDI